MRDFEALAEIDRDAVALCDLVAEVELLRVCEAVSEIDCEGEIDKDNEGVSLPLLSADVVPV